MTISMVPCPTWHNPLIHPQKKSEAPEIPGLPIFFTGSNSNGLNDFRKDKSGKKLAKSEEDLLEHRTDAFSPLYIGTEKLPYHNSFSPCPHRVYRKKSHHIYIYVKLFS